MPLCWLETLLIWLIAAVSIAGILFRPRDWPEAVWACGGAALLVLLRLLPTNTAVLAAGKGTDVYLFLTGMMLLAELSRREGVFDWIASAAVKAAKGSRSRLFALIYAAGVVVTVFLSNDATAVVLTPAVYAAVQKAGGAARPYLFACAFIANAASFVLPISNPANLVVYGKNLPELWPWLQIFALPSLVSIAVTFGALRVFCRRELEGPIEPGAGAVRLGAAGRGAVWGIVATAVVLTGASAMGQDLGGATCIAAAVTVVAVTRGRVRDIRAVAGAVSWSVLPLVAGLFVIVEAMNQAGAVHLVGAALACLNQLPVWLGTPAASFAVAALCNLMNNLPGGLLLGGGLSAVHVSPQLRDAVLLGVDLGPNLSVTGSLATVLWLIALRREGEKINGWAFLKAGIVVMTPALALAALALVIAAAMHSTSV